jgi:hypothetical protein
LPLFRESGNRFATHVREVDVREINWPVVRVTNS